MKISELKEQFNKVGLIKDLFYIKYYLPISDKKVMINKILSDGIYDKDGFKYCDYVNLTIAKDISYVLNYTDLEFDSQDIEKIIIDYDWLVENEVVKFIKENIPDDEKYIIEEIIYESIEQELKIENSLEKMLANKLDKLINLIPSEKALNKLLKEVPKAINKIDPDKLQFVKNAVDTLGGQNG